jgi:enolase-phosphatase E1
MNAAAPGYRGVLLDIEGTTTPISFVYEVLFPYALGRLEEACSRVAADPRIREAVTCLRKEYAAEEASGNTLPAFDGGAPYARFLMERDRKSTGLKMLQGVIWEEGYRIGSLQGVVFLDVVPSLQAWKAADIQVRIFSSGSVLAQKLLFGHTGQGDLTPLLTGFHDTQTGPKQEPESYRVIAREFGFPAPDILFLSDVFEELDAARSAGMKTGLVIRPGNKPVVGEHGHEVYSSTNQGAARSR